MTDDDKINDGKAKGFDSIFDNPNFAGGQFSYWQRQAVPLFGVNLEGPFGPNHILRQRHFFIDRPLCPEPLLNLLLAPTPFDQSPLLRRSRTGDADGCLKMAFGAGFKKQWDDDGRERPSLAAPLLNRT